MSNNNSDKTDYSKTLYLPKTDFPMRAGLPKREPEWLKRWEDMGLYQRLREQSKGREKFILHDGPPYANGHIHIGTAINKMLKDLVSRSMQMLGYDSPYVPGWDCHGLPIEWKIEEQYRAKGKNKDDVPINEFRKECRTFAAKWIDVQREEFKQLGVVGEWDNPYTTMAFDAEATIAQELMKFSMSGQLYRGSKPVMWSVVERTALAEAEIEYHDVESDAIWVKFPVSKSLSTPSPHTGVAWITPVFDEDGNINEKVEQETLYPSSLVGASIVIWTTTPWTIPANRAISYSDKISYGLYEITVAENEFGPQVGERLIFADALAQASAEQAKLTFQRLRDVTADELASIICAHPLQGLRPTSPLTGEVAKRSEAGGGEAAYSMLIPLLEGDHVTDEAGTGFVHTAPGHGMDDYEIWNAKARENEAKGIDTTIPMCVDEAGYYTKDVPFFGTDSPDGAARVIDDKGKKGDANKRVIAALIEANNLFSRYRIKHSYPHSWRSKKPIIFRNTPQWFVYMDKDLEGKIFDFSTDTLAQDPSSAPSGHLLPQGEKEVEREMDIPSPLAGEGGTQSVSGEGLEQKDTLRNRALAAIDKTKFVPEARRNRLRAMIETRPDWVLSRQRAWGVPISVFVNKETDEILKDEAVNKRIVEAFENEGADAWFENASAKRFLGDKYNVDEWQQVTDILDVWFDSGSTHAFVLRNKKRWPHLQFPATVYMEGTDQHRGWFHSSLLESCGTNGFAPYESVLTHGFTMDKKGFKMSKSLGNTVAPQDIIKQYGADILRLWAASIDYTEDHRIGDEILKNNVESYRKMRNSFRFLLGNLAHFKPEEAVAQKDMPELEQLMLHRLFDLDKQVKKAYFAYDYKKVVSLLSNFMNIELSAFYFDIRKDALYCDAPSSNVRRSALTVLNELFNHLTIWLAPILVFTMEEIWLERYDEKDSCVHLQTFPEIDANWQNEALANKWTKIRSIRKVVTGALEIERKEKNIGSSLEAAPKVYISDTDLFVAQHDSDMAEICITSDIEIIQGEGPAEAFRLEDVAGVSVVFERAEGIRCERSWKFSSDVGADKDYPDISPRDAKAMRELKDLGLLPEG
ncbi:MAG: isoleucine--tRNA ligase [Devosiaceae bacterium]|nr:isoleucine--tRNA ligase [Devosiaceae bacterium]